MGHSWGKPGRGHARLVMLLLQEGDGQLEGGWVTGLCTTLESRARSKLRTYDASHDDVQPDEHLNPAQDLSPVKLPTGSIPWKTACSGSLCWALQHGDRLAFEERKGFLQILHPSQLTALFYV